MDVANMIEAAPSAAQTVGVVPVLVGPLQALMTILPGILIAIGGVIAGLLKPTAMKRVLQLMWSQKFIMLGVLVVLAGVVTAAVYAWSFLFAVSTGNASALESSQADWPAYRGGAARLGSVGGQQDDPAHGKVVWSFVDGKINTFYSSPSVVGNRVYATSAKYEYFSDSGAIYGIDADTGKPAWIFRGGKYRSTFSSPAVSGKYLVVGEGLHLTKDARVFCLDVVESEKKHEGVKLWEFRTKSHVESSPCIADGRAYIGAGDDGLYCFALDPKDGNAEVLWHKEGKDYPDCETSPIVVDGKVYFGMGIGGQAICCLDAKTGEELWRVPAPYPVFGSPAVADGKLYVGMGHGDFVNTAEALSAKVREEARAAGKTEEEAEEEARKIFPIGEVWCIDITSAEPKVLWQFKTARTILGTVAVEGDSVYFGSRDGTFYCVSTSGQEKEKWDAHAPLITSPAIGKELVYVMTETGELYGLTKSRLAPVWSVSLNAQTFSSPAVARGHVYVGTIGNGLLCVGEPGAEKRESIWAGALGGSGKAGSVDGSLLSARGTYAWGYADAESAADGTQIEGTPTIDTPAACVDGTIYVGLNQGSVHGLLKLDAAEDLGKKPARQWFAPSKNAVTMSAAATGGKVYFVDGRTGDEGRALRCLNAADGKELWQRPVATDASGEFIITYTRLYIADTGKGLSCLDLTTPGEAVQLWQGDVGGAVVGVPTIGADLVMAAVASPAKLVAMDSQTGVEVWEQPLPVAPTTGAAYVAQRVWVGTGRGLVAYGLVKDTEPLGTECGAMAGRLAVDGNMVIGTNDAGEMIVAEISQVDVTPSTAEESPKTPASKAELMEATRVAGLIGGFPPLVTDSGILYVAEGAIQRWDPATKQSEQWTAIRPSWPGLVTTPMVMVNSHILFGTDKRGLVCMKPKS